MNSPNSSAARRLASLRAGLAELDLHGLLVSHNANVRYLTGFTGSNGWLLLDHGQAIFVTDGRYEEQAEGELAADGDFELVVLRDEFITQLAERAGREFAGRKVGFEGPHLSYGNWARFEENGGDVAWTAVSGVVEDLRIAKDEVELAAIRKAGAIAADALHDTVALVEPGMREVDIASELDYRMRRLGAEGPAFETIVASGERTALPHAATSERSVGEGDFLLCDFGARWDGYCSDVSRTFVVGQPRARQSEIYDVVLEAQAAARAALREGVTGADVDAAARDVFAARDLEERFLHSTGHGLGLEVHEDPRLAKRSERPLEANMVVTVEPGLYFPGWGGVRIEDDLVVTREGAEALVELESDRLLSLPL
jgi:Xaa-Pro aminopeptidase